MYELVKRVLLSFAGGNVREFYAAHILVCSYKSFAGAIVQSNQIKYHLESKHLWWWVVCLYVENKVNKNNSQLQVKSSVGRQYIAIVLGIL